MTFRVVKINNHIPGMTWVVIVNTPPDQVYLSQDPSWTLLISPARMGWVSYYWDGSKGRLGITETPELTEEFLALLSDEQKAEAIASAMRNRSTT